MNSRHKIFGLEWVGAVEGDLIRFVTDANGDVVGQLINRPSDWAAQESAGTPYVFGIVGGLPDWRIGTLTTVGTGYGNNYGNDYGGPA